MDSGVKVKDYKKRWGELDTEFAEWRPHYQDLSDFFLPRSGRFFTSDRTHSQSRYNKLNDNTATRAVKVLSAGLMAGMTSPARPWFRLTTPDTQLAQYEPVKLWLNDVTRMMQTVFSRSNMYRALHTMYEELAVFGTASNFVADDFKSVIHNFSFTAGEYRLATNYKGEVDCFYRVCSKTVAQLVKEFGKANCSATVQNLYTTGALDARVEIVHVIEPRDDRNPFKKDAMNMAWRSLYFERGGNEDKFLREGGFKRFRILAPRWTERPGDVYGISPGMEALGDSRQLQHEQLRKAQAIDYQTLPPIALPNAAKGQESNYLPGGVSYFDSASQNAVQSLFNVNLNLQYLREDIVDVRERINASFFADLFQMLAMSDRRQMTATEVAERHEEKLLMLGPVLERQHNELLDPAIDITFERMLNAGIVPPPPPELHGMDLQVEFVSMLAQAQSAVGVNAVDRLLMTIGQVAAMKPDVVDKLNADEMVDQVSDMLGVNPNMIVADDKVAIVRKQREQQQQAQQQAMVTEQAARATNQLAGADTSGHNALTDITRMFSGL